MTQDTDSDDDGSSIDNPLSGINTKLLGIKIAVALIAVIFVYQFRPLFHDFIYLGLYSLPGAIFLGGSVILGAVLFFSPPKRSENEYGQQQSSFKIKGVYLTLGVGILLFLAIILAIPAGMAEGAALSSDTMSSTDEIGSLPQTNADNPRIIPRAVSDTQTKGSVSYRQHQLGVSDIARAENGNLAWSYAIEPDQFRNRLQGNQRGVLLADMTRMENRSITAYDDQDFTHGQNMFLHRSAIWNILKDDYLVTYHDDPIEFTHNGEAYMQYPKTGHEWNLLPFPHTVPTWEGNVLVHTDGTIEHLSPKEAKNSDILDGQRLYPLYNSEQRVESLRYRQGILNQLPVVGTYESVVVPAELPSGTGNSQPFVIDLEPQDMSYVYAMEPHGSTSRGLDEVWFFDAETGESEFFGSDNETIFGPERAMGLVRSADSQTGWVNEAGEGNFEVVEPIPIAVDGDLWWHSKVVPVENTDVSRNVFVNAHSGTTVSLESTDNIKEFIREGNINEIPEDADTDTEPAPDEPEVAYYVVIRDENGNEIDRIPIEPGQDISIETP